MTTPTPFLVNLPTTTFLSNNYEQSWLVIQNRLTDIALKMNIRQIGFFNLLETPTGQQWFNNPVTGIQRQALRQVYQFGAIAAGTSLNIPYNIVNTATLTFTHIYGTAQTDAPDSRPLPYVDVTNVTNQIGLNIVGTNIVTTVGATSANVLSGYIVLEYLKN